MDVLSECTHWKLWVFFPPSPINLALLEQVATYTRRLQRIWSKLEHGSYALVAESEACFIPAGYLHATYSLESSFTVGTTWSSAESLSAAVDMLVKELRFGAEIRVATQADLCDFLRSLAQALQRKLYDDCREAMMKLCPHKLQIGGKSGPLLGQLKSGGKSIKRQVQTLIATVEEGIMSSDLAQVFWACEEPTCAQLLGHIK
jgi:hypothetical protein